MRLDSCSSNLILLREEGEGKNFLADKIKSNREEQDTDRLAIRTRPEQV